MARMEPSVTLDAALRERPAYLETLEGLVRLESPTHDKAAVDALAQHLETLL